MTRTIKSDNDKEAISQTLRAYTKAHPGAEVKVQRQNSVSLRIRIIDPAFQGKDLVQRDDELWKILEPLPESVQSQITMLLLLTPEEAESSFANVEFENPIRSRL